LQNILFPDLIMKAGNVAADTESNFFLFFFR